MTDLFANPGRLLAVAPHPDDIELGAGATIARLAKQGWQIVALVLSDASLSLPDGAAPDTATRESEQALRQLGVATIEFASFPVRHFPEHRQAILDRLIQARRDHAPTLVMAPGASDHHQDHATVAAEAWRAFVPGASLLGYDMPWNGPSAAAMLVAAIEPEHLEAKIAALAAFDSQATRDYMDPAFARALARVRAARTPSELAERFEVRHLFSPVGTEST